MISEKQLEDFVCEHPEYTFWEGVEIIGRQVRVEHGIIDVLAWDYRVLVVELKARKLKEEDIGQVLRYTYDVKEAIQSAIMGSLPDSLMYNHTPWGLAFQEWWTRLHGYLDEHPRNHIQPILIGTRIDDKTLAAARGGGIEVLLWRYDKDKNTITIHYPRLLQTPSNNGNPWWIRRLQKAMSYLCLNEAEHTISEMEIVTSPGESTYLSN